MAGKYRCALPALVAAAVVASACHPVPVLPPEIVDETFETQPSPGTPELWDDLLARVAADGRHRAGLIERGEDALLLRLNLIRSARRTIDIQTFIWKNDECGRLVMWELLKAVTQRGVRVRILVDEAFNAVEPRVLAGLATLHPALEFRLYNPSTGRMNPSLIRVLQAAAEDPRKINVRMHNKLFLVDGGIAVAGGRNYSNKYYDRALGLNFKDRDVLVAGPAAATAEQSFEDYWTHPWSVPATELLDIRAAIAAGDATIDHTGTGFRFHHLFTELLPRVGDPAVIGAWLRAHVAPVDDARFVVDRPDKNGSGGLAGSGRLTDVLRSLIAHAEEAVTIQSPYLALSEPALALFRTRRAERPGLRVLISTNSLAATDSWQTYAYSYKQKRIYLQELGFEIREFMPLPGDIDGMMDREPLLRRRPTPDEVAEGGGDPFDPDGSEGCRNAVTGTIPYLCLHQKSVVVDGRHAFVGSYNFDPRSGNLNTELGFLIEDVAFARRLEEEIRRDAAPANSFLIAPVEQPGLLQGLSAAMQRFSEQAPSDLWPFRCTASFRLRPGAEPVPPGDPDFYRNWEDLGGFPLLGLFSEKAILTRLLKVYGQPLMPLVRGGSRRGEADQRARLLVPQREAEAVPAVAQAEAARRRQLGDLVHAALQLVVGDAAAQVVDVVHADVAAEPA